MRAVDNQGLAGAFHLGTNRAGFDIIAKLEHAGGFGNDLMQANSHIIGDMAEGYHSDPLTWPAYDDIQYVFGNPPCSGFSGMNTSAAARRKRGQELTSNATGPRSKINDCMWDFIRYAARVNGGKGPDSLAFESVQQAGRKGLVLMRELRAEMEELTGEQYSITHLFMSGATVGAAQVRKRYFFVLMKGNVPFGIDVPDVKPGTYYDAIADLQGIDNTTWDLQPTKYAPTQWVLDNEINPNGFVRDHISQEHERFQSVIEDFEIGDNYKDVLFKVFDRDGKLPDVWEKTFAQWGGDLYKKDNWGFYGPRKIDPAKLGYVIMGGATLDFVHWEENRFLTVRELARLQGFPDDWSFEPAGRPMTAAAWIGKGVPVQSGQFVSNHVRLSLEGNPGANIGEPTDDEFAEPRERVINITLDYKKQWSYTGNHGGRRTHR